jgi:hypothetical protein
MGAAIRAACPEKSAIEELGQEDVERGARPLRRRRRSHYSLWPHSPPALRGHDLRGGDGGAAEAPDYSQMR